MNRDELIDRLEGRISRIKEKSSEIAESGMERIAEVAGGAGAGFADAEWSERQVLGFPVQQVTGFGFAIGGVMNAFGKYSQQIGAFGGGMLAYEAGKATREARLKKKNKSTTAGVGSAAPALTTGARVSGRELDSMISRVASGQ